MLRVLVTVCLLALVRGQVREKFTLCNYDSISQSKCEMLIEDAQLRKIPLSLTCLEKDNRAECFKAVSKARNHVMVLDQHGYLAARKEELRPVVFARAKTDTYYVVVAPNDITLTEYIEATLAVDTSDENAFHSALAFNLLRGRNICPKSILNAEKRSIRVVKSSELVANSTDILICRYGNFTTDIKQAPSCNFNMNLQNAVFVPKSFKDTQIKDLQTVFSTIYRRFRTKEFNFFDTFDEADDVIFKNKTTGFDNKPTYENGVDEKMFSSLHCDRPDFEHNDEQLGDDIKSTKVCFMGFCIGK